MRIEGDGRGLESAMSYLVIALSPGGGGVLQSTHESREAADKEAAHLNRLPLPFRYVVVERTS